MKIAWFSAGITSAVACKLALDKYSDVEIYYIETGAAHEDNRRFIAECESWYNKKINIIQNSKGYADQVDVILKTKFINSPKGARCTKELKKQVREDLQKTISAENQIFGFEFEAEEINRAVRFIEQHPETKPLFPLIENKLSKNNCAAIVESVGIKLPVMYKLGYNNNNCIGCTKGGQGYWNKIRKDFPEWFERMAKAERVINRTCLKEAVKGQKAKRIFLDELPENSGHEPIPVMPECGIFCQVEFAHIMDARVVKIMNGEMDINEIQKAA